MDNSFHSQRLDIRRPEASFAALLTKIFDMSLHWLVGFIQLTEEEQKEAGIYLDRLGGE